jgi:hypothetical protein
MAGILDSKTRIMDSVITETGKRQITSGRLKAEFISFTDGATYYEADKVTGDSDVTARIYFESTGHRKQDFITFETDDSGNLLGYPTDSELSLVGDSIFKSDSKAEVEDINNFVFVSGSGDFASLSAGIVTSSIDHFKQLRMIGTVEGAVSNFSHKFEVDNDNLSFSIINTFPWPDGPPDSKSNIDAVEPFFVDKRLSHIPNFKFLPPLTGEPYTTPFNLKTERRRARRKSSKFRHFLGQYTALNEKNGRMTYEDLMVHLNGEGSDGIDPGYLKDYETVQQIEAWSSQGEDGSTTGTVMGTVFAGQQMGIINVNPIDAARERHSVNFIKTSSANNIVMQIFETDSEKLTFKKLDVIDYGEIVTESSIRQTKRVFFVGKILLNSVKIPVFVNLFTLILD